MIPDHHHVIAEGGYRELEQLVMEYESRPRTFSHPAFALSLKQFIEWRKTNALDFNVITKKKDTLFERICFFSFTIFMLAWFIFCMWAGYSFLIWAVHRAGYFSSVG